MSLWSRSTVLLLLMLLASGLALALRPTQKIADLRPPIDLEKIIPVAFGEWHQEHQDSVQVVDPQQQEMIERIYTQTLSRTYINTHGYRVMLAIAYGDDQRDSMQVHYPEICYPAQGFSLKGKETGILNTASGAIPVTRILTNLGQRNEPVTYWTIVGERVFQGGIQKKLVEMSYGLNGEIPDGILIRVSSIDAETDNAYRMQTQFVDQMLHTLAPEHRQRLNGSPLTGSEQ